MSTHVEKVGQAMNAIVQTGVIGEHSMIIVAEGLSTAQSLCYGLAHRAGWWAGLAERWDEIVATFLEEVGLNWTKGKSAPRTYALMKQALGRDA